MVKLKENVNWRSGFAVGLSAKLLAWLWGIASIPNALAHAHTYSEFPTKLTSPDFDEAKDYGIKPFVPLYLFRFLLHKKNR